MKKILIALLLVGSVFCCFAFAEEILLEGVSFENQANIMTFLTKKQYEICEGERDFHIKMLVLAGICFAVSSLMFHLELFGDNFISKLSYKGRHCAMQIALIAAGISILVGILTAFNTPTCKKYTYFDKAMENFISNSECSDFFKNKVKIAYEDDKEAWIRHFNVIDGFTWFAIALTIVASGFICLTAIVPKTTD